MTMNWVTSVEDHRDRQGSIGRSRRTQQHHLSGILRGAWDSLIYEWPWHQTRGVDIAVGPRLIQAHSAQFLTKQQLLLHVAGPWSTHATCSKGHRPGSNHEITLTVIKTKSVGTRCSQVTLYSYFYDEIYRSLSKMCENVEPHFHALIFTMRRDAGTRPWHALTFLPSMLMTQVAQSPCLQLYFTWHSSKKFIPWGHGRTRIGLLSSATNTQFSPIQSRTRHSSRNWRLMNSGYLFIPRGIFLKDACNVHGPKTTSVLQYSPYGADEIRVKRAIKVWTDAAGWFIGKRTK